MWDGETSLEPQTVHPKRRHMRELAEGTLSPSDRVRDERGVPGPTSDCIGTPSADLLAARP
jgi:hypothetical protein